MCVNWCNLFLGEALINRSVATSVDSFVGNFVYGFWVSNLPITWTHFIRPAAVRLKTVSGKKRYWTCTFLWSTPQLPETVYSYRCFGFSVWPTAKNGLSVCFRFKNARCAPFWKPALTLRFKFLLWYRQYSSLSHSLMINGVKHRPEWNLVK